jgi:hypothetical protein
MSTSPHHVSATVRGSVYYAARSDHRRLFHYAYAPHGTEETNIEFVEHVVEIADVRRSLRPLRLEFEGASVLRHRSDVRRFYDEEELRRVGYPETAELVRSVTGATNVVVFDHNIRGRSDQPKVLTAGGVRPPVFHIHTDFTDSSARARAAAVPGAAATSGQRMAAINVWRPIAGPLRDCPLAICDASSVEEWDLLATDLLYPDRTRFGYSRITIPPWMRRRDVLHTRLLCTPTIPGWPRVKVSSFEPSHSSTIDGHLTGRSPRVQASASIEPFAKGRCDEAADCVDSNLARRIVRRHRRIRSPGTG